jgi:hypothetical protein
VSDLPQPPVSSAATTTEDLDAEGFGYWPSEAQDAIRRRDAEIERLGEASRDLELLAVNVEMVRKFGRAEIDAGSDAGEVFDRSLAFIAGFVNGTVAMVVPPAMWDPVERDALVARGRALAEEHGW